MKIEELIWRHPTLFHMAEDGSWPSIQKQGLLSTSELLDLYSYIGAARDAIESEWRSRKVRIRRMGQPDVIIRDQIPMRPDRLRPCLDPDVTTSIWYKLVNGRIFFWPTWKYLQIFLSANSYVNSPHVVISVDTRRLLERYEDRITLSEINSGSAYYNPELYAGPLRRGRQTFKPISEFNGRFVHELVVERGIPDLSGIVKCVERWIARGTNGLTATFEKLETLWTEPTP
jgi:hypothetical protein